MLRMYARLNVKVVERPNGAFEAWFGARFERDGLRTNLLTAQELVTAMGPSVAEGFIRGQNAINQGLRLVTGDMESWDPQI